MGGAAEGGAPMPRFGLLVFSSLIFLGGEPASAVLPRARKAPLQDGGFAAKQNMQPGGWLSAVTPHEAVDSYYEFRPPQDEDLDYGWDNPDDNESFETQGSSALETGSNELPRVNYGEMWDGFRSSRAVRKPAGRYQRLSALQVADQPQDEREGSENKSEEESEDSESAQDSKDSQAEQEQQKDESQDATDSSTADSSDSKASGSNEEPSDEEEHQHDSSGGSQEEKEKEAPSEGSKTEQDTESAKESGASSAPTGTKAEQASAAEGEAKQPESSKPSSVKPAASESKEEEEEEEEEEPEEASKQEKATAAPEGKDTASEEKPQPKPGAAASSAEEEKEEGGEATEQGEKSESEAASASSETQEKSQAAEKEEGASKSEEGSKEEKQAKSGDEASEKATDSSETEGKPEGALSKESEAEKGESLPEAPQPQQPPTPTEGTAATPTEVPAPEGGEGEVAPSAPGAQAESASAEESASKSETSVTGPPTTPPLARAQQPTVEEKGATVSAPGRASDGETPTTVPEEESRPEGVEGAAKPQEAATMGQGRCYTEVVQEVLEIEQTLRENASKNVHFQEAEQAFCDEIFRRIDGPYSLGELSALLRAADVADSLHRNFRYCRATPTSSPPRVKDGDSILHAAIAARKPQIVEVLLQYGAFTELPGIPQGKKATGENALVPLTTSMAETANERPIHAAAVIQALDSMEAVEMLLQYGAKVDSRDSLGRTPLMVAAFHSKPQSHEFVKKLILAGADVKATDSAGLTALHYATAADNWQVIRILLDHGADPRAADVRRNTPLHYGAAFNAYQSTTKLLEKGSELLDINAQNADGKTPLHFAAAPTSFQAVPRAIVPAFALETLLLHHANPMARDSQGNNPLHLAARGGYVEILRRLVGLTNIPAEEKNSAGLTPLAAAQQSLQGPTLSEIEQFLVAYAEKKSCIEPPTVRHSTRIFSDTVLGPYMRVGDTVTYTCNPGFELFGHATVICQERDGKMEFVPDAPLCVLQEVQSHASTAAASLALIAAVALSAVYAACT